jgi:hypothetical protein
MRLDISRFLRRRGAALSLVVLLVAPVLGCQPSAPEPAAETKEERRLQEKEMMQREMRNE